MGYVCETFLRSIRHACTHVEGMSNGDVVRLLTNLLSNGWRASVCEGEGLLLGWIAHPFDFSQFNGLAWAYVRDMVRGQGVGKFLLNYAGVDTSRPITTPFLPNRARVKWRLIHRPYLVLPADSHGG